MSQSDLRTNFNTAPTEGAEAIDAYNADKIQSFVAGRSDAELETVVTNVYPGADPQKVIKVLRDPKTAEYVGEAGITVDQAFTYLKGVTPPGVSFSNALDFGSLGESTDFFTQLKDYMPAYEFSTMDLDFTKGMFVKFKEYKGKMGFDGHDASGGGFDYSAVTDMFAGAEWPSVGGFSEDSETGIFSDFDFGFGLGTTGFFDSDNSGTTKGTSWAERLGALDFGKAKGLYDDLAGIDSVNYIMEMAEKYQIMDKLMAAAADIDWVKYIEDSNLSDAAKEWLFTDGVDLAAKYGYEAYIQKLIAAAGDRFQPFHQKQTVKTLLAGYLKPRGMTTAEHITEANRFANLLFDIDSEWITYSRGGVDNQTTTPFIDASYSAIDILKFDDRTKLAAIVYGSRRPSITNFKALARRDYPYIVFT